MSIRKLYYALPPGLRLLARKLYYLPIDTWEAVSGKRGRYEPPKGDIYIGSGDFIRQGRHQLDLLQRFIDLQAGDAVLDVGSGIGRTAVALTTFLSREARYEGFDVVEKGVNWCNATIRRDFPNFNFRYVPLNNDLYNNSKQKAVEFRFPYDNEQFDKVFLFSVFTHMQIEEIAHYLCEIARVLRPGGQCLATFFLYNKENESRVMARAGFHFPVKREGYRLMDEQVKSANIALDEQLLAEFVAAAGLQQARLIQGYWMDPAMKTADNSFQDVVVLKKAV